LLLSVLYDRKQLTYKDIAEIAKAVVLSV